MFRLEKICSIFSIENHFDPKNQNYVRKRGFEFGQGLICHMNEESVAYRLTRNLIPFVLYLGSIYISDCNYILIIGHQLETIKYRNVM